MCPCRMRNIGSLGRSLVLIVRKLRFWFTMQDVCIRQLVVKGGGKKLSRNAKGKEKESVGGEEKKERTEFWPSTSRFWPPNTGIQDKRDDSGIEYR